MRMVGLAAPAEAGATPGLGAPPPGAAEQRPLAVARLVHAEALLLQVVAQKGQQRRLVLDDEDGGLGRAGGGGGDVGHRGAAAVSPAAGPPPRPNCRPWGGLPA